MNCPLLICFYSLDNPNVELVIQYGAASADPRFDLLSLVQVAQRLGRLRNLQRPSIFLWISQSTAIARAKQITAAAAKSTPEVLNGLQKLSKAPPKRTRQRKMDVDLVSQLRNPGVLASARFLATGTCRRKPYNDFFGNDSPTLIDTGVTMATAEFCCDCHGDPVLERFKPPRLVASTLTDDGTAMAGRGANTPYHMKNAVYLALQEWRRDTMPQVRKERPYVLSQQWLATDADFSTLAMRSIRVVDLVSLKKAIPEWARFELFGNEVS